MPRRPVLRRTIFAFLVTGTIAARGGSQSPPNATADQIWAPAAQIHEIKNQFVAAVRQLAEALSGTYGDEGTRIPTTIEAVDRVRLQWDDAIRQYEAMLTRAAETAEVHVALGTVYLDRQRIDDALREFATAGRLDPGRADVHRLAALAYGLGNRPEEAAEALRQASTLDAGNPITLYGLAQSQIRSGHREQAAATLRTFQESLQGKLAALGGNVQAAAPFERVSLLRQAPGVAPIFPPNSYRQGFGLLLNGSYDRALAEIRRAAADDPIVADSRGADDPVAAAGVALRRGELRLALTGLEAAVNAAPNRSEAHRILGVAYWVDGQYEKSIAQLRKAIDLASTDERSRMALADVLVEGGRGAEAERVLKEAVQAIPDTGPAHYRLGQLYQTLTLLPQATHEFEAAAALDPLVGLDRLYETIGGLYSNQANFDASIDAYAKRLDVNPNSADGHRKLAEIYFLQGRNDEALAEFVAALLIDPKNVDALAGAGQVYLRMGRYGEALETSKRVIVLDAAHKGARYALATSLMRLGQLDEGKRELEIFQRMQAEAIASTQRESELKAVKLAAARRLAAGDFTAAAALLQQALTHDPNDLSVHRDLGVALIKAGQFEQAIVSLDRSLRLQDTAEAHHLMAEAYKALGRLAESQAQTALSMRAIERMKEERLRKISGSR